MTDIIIYSNIENVNRVHKKFKFIKKTAFLKSEEDCFDRPARSVQVINIECRNPESSVSHTLAVQSALYIPTRFF